MSVKIKYIVCVKISKFILSLKPFSLRHKNIHFTKRNVTELTQQTVCLKNC